MAETTNAQQRASQALAGMSPEQMRNINWNDFSEYVCREPVKDTSVATPTEVSANATNALDGVLNIANPDTDKDTHAGNAIKDDIKKMAELYGNNVFSLEVENTAIIGVLKELPKLSLTSEWQDNAPTEIINTITKLVTNNTKLQVINSILGVKQIPFVAGGAATTRMYTGCSQTEFNLQFRIYSVEAIGPLPSMTGYRRALAALCLYAPALHTYDPSTLLTLSTVNLGRSAIAVLNVIGEGVDYANEKVSGKKTDNTKATEGTKNAIDSAKSVASYFGDAGSAVMSAFFDDNNTDRNKHLKDAMKNADAMIDSAQKLLHSDALIMNDATRVNSTLNYSTGMFGGAIWNLTILPGIFKNKIPVYVKNWSAKPSKEIDSHGKAAYVDFTITCVMDQIKPGSWWNNIMYSPEADRYKNIYSDQVEQPD